MNDSRKVGLNREGHSGRHVVSTRIFEEVSENDLGEPFENLYPSSL